MERSDILAIITEMTDLVGGKESLTEYYKNYSVNRSGSHHRCSPAQHRLHAGMGVNLYRRAKQAGATPEELRRAAMYALSAIDCLKYQLDIRAIADDLHIKDLKAKYPAASI